MLLSRADGGGRPIARLRVCHTLWVTQTVITGSIIWGLEFVVIELVLYEVCLVYEVQIQESSHDRVYRIFFSPFGALFLSQARVFFVDWRLCANRSFTVFHLIR